MVSVAGHDAVSARGGRPTLDQAVVQRFYDRMRAVAPAAVGAIDRDRANDPGPPFDDTGCGRLVRSLDEAGVRALGMWAHHWCVRCYDDDIRVGLRLVREIAGRPGLGWTPDEVRWMFGESQAAGPAAGDRFVLPVAAAGQLGPAGLAGLRSELVAVLERLEPADGEHPDGEWWLLRSLLGTRRIPAQARSADD